MSRSRSWRLRAATTLLALAALCASYWQWSRLVTRRANNARILAARALPPIALTASGPLDTTLIGRRLQVRGHFDVTPQRLLRGRVHDEAPGLEVATPFVLEGSDVVLWVLRGFVASPDAATPPAEIPLPTEGVVTLTGLALPIPVTSDAGQPLARQGHTTWRRLDRADLATRTPGTPPVYLLLAGGKQGPGGLPSIEPPTLDDGPHLSYAIQWIGIAIAIFAFGIIVGRRDGRGSAPPPAVP